MTIIQNSKFKIQNCFTDSHSHILSGIDDGAASMKESVNIARVLEEIGFSAVCCTPHHIRGSYDADGGTVLQKIEELQEVLDREGINLELHQGNEYYLDEYLAASLDGSLTLRGSEHILVEIPGHATADHVKETCYRIRCAGYVPVIAHPERCPLLELPAPPKKGILNWFKVQGSKLGGDNSKFKIQNSKFDSSSLLSYLEDLGCFFQGNIGSFAGVYGDRVRRKAIAFLREGLYDCLGSDAHRSHRLEEWLRKGIGEIEKQVGEEGLRHLMSGKAMEREGFRQIAACT
jgi:protein-tyrosine phosphatase